MRVRSSGSERAHTNASRMRGIALPVRQLGLNVKRRIGEVDVGVQRLGMQRRNKLLVLDLQQGFGDGCNSCSRLEMSDVRFDRSDGTELLLLGGAFERLKQPCNLAR